MTDTVETPTSPSAATPEIRGCSPATYLMVAALIAAAILACVLCINMLVDPLLYREGNLITGQNYTFDERTSKAIHFSTLKSHPSCILFGPSSGTLMNDAGKIAGVKECYNFAFSAGRPEEFEYFARWVEKYSSQPRTVIIDIDYSSLMPRLGSLPTPRFILKGESPPSRIVSYLSIRALIFSLRTLLHLAPLPRYYNREFQTEVFSWVRPYVSGKNHAFEQLTGPFQSRDAIAGISSLRSIWPGSKIICYVPPITIDFIGTLEKRGTLRSYIEVLAAISHRCDSFHDFSIPTDLTSDPLTTYDGSHFLPSANARVAAALAGNGDLPLSSVSGLSLEEYERRFREAYSVERNKPQKRED